MPSVNKIKLPNNTTVDINDARDVIIGDGVENVVILTSAQYDALATKDPNTLYLVTDRNVPASSGGGGGGIEDVTLGGTSVVSNGVAVLPAYPTVPTISTSIASDATSDTKTASPKSVKTYVDGIVGDIETLLAAI